MINEINPWDYDEPIAEHITVPPWIEQDITFADVAAIYQGGCESGAYMPACTYHEARKTMSEHGDDVLDYLDDWGGSEELIDLSDHSWSGLACHLLSSAVDLWANVIYDDLVAILEDKQEEDG